MLRGAWNKLLKISVSVCQNACSYTVPPLTNATRWQVKVVNVEQERQVMEDVIRTLDRHENDNLPQVKLGTTEVQCIEHSV